MPFLSKVTGVPMVDLATQASCSARALREQGYAGGLWPRQPLVAVKAPVFSMAKLRGVEVNLGPEMKSTGEVMGIDRDLRAGLRQGAAGRRAWRCRHARRRRRQLADATSRTRMRLDRSSSIRMGCTLYATEGTAAMIEQHGMPVQMVTKRIGTRPAGHARRDLDGTVDGVINTPGPAEKEVLDGFQIRRAAVEKGIPCITSVDTARAVVEAMRLSSGAYSIMPLPSYRERVTVGY